MKIPLAPTTKFHQTVGVDDLGDPSANFDDISRNDTKVVPYAFRVGAIHESPAENLRKPTVTN